MFAGLGRGVAWLGLLLRGGKWATRTPSQDDRCGRMGWFGCYSAGALMDDYLRRVSPVLGGDERGSGGSRLQGATDGCLRPKRGSDRRPPLLPSSQCPISDSALAPKPWPDGPPLAAEPSPAQPKKGSPNERGLLSGVRRRGCQCCSCAFLFAAGKSSPLASASQQTLHNQGICKRREFPHAS
jgi:hypothetical protein